MSAVEGLERFVAAQEPIYARALDEIRRGKKRSHWMWFVFPQLAGLGRSAAAQLYAIADAEEARFSCASAARRALRRVRVGAPGSDRQ